MNAQIIGKESFEEVALQVIRVNGNETDLWFFRGADRPGPGLQGAESRDKHDFQPPSR